MTSILDDILFIKEKSDEIKNVTVFDERRFSSAFCDTCLTELEWIEGSTGDLYEPSSESGFYCPDCQEFRNG